MPVLVGDFAIDCVMTLAPEYNAEVTRFPIGRGGTGSDHRIRKPTEIVLEGIVSDTPIGSLIAIRDKQSAEAGGDFIPSKAADAFFQKLHADSTFITITTDVGSWPDMLLESYSPAYDSGTGKALRWSARFVEAQLVDVSRVTVRVKLPSTARKKAVGVPPVIFNSNNEDGLLITNSGKTAVLSDKGVYEYADASGKTTGRAVPAYEFNTTPVELPEEPNTTYFDRESDRWLNTDGTPVTQQQLDRKKSLPTARDRSDTSSPWYRR